MKNNLKDIVNTLKSIGISKIHYNDTTSLDFKYNFQNFQISINEESIILSYNRFVDYYFVNDSDVMPTIKNFLSNIIQ